MAGGARSAACGVMPVVPPSRIRGPIQPRPGASPGAESRLKPLLQRDARLRAALRAAHQAAPGAVPAAGPGPAPRRAERYLGAARRVRRPAPAPATGVRHRERDQWPRLSAGAGEPRHLRPRLRPRPAGRHALAPRRDRALLGRHRHPRLRHAGPPAPRPLPADGPGDPRGPSAAVGNRARPCPLHRHPRAAHRRRAAPVRGPARGPARRAGAPRAGACGLRLPGGEPCRAVGRRVPGLGKVSRRPGRAGRAESIR